MALELDRRTSALLALDYQNDVIDLVPHARELGVLPRAAAALDAARRAFLPVIHVRLAFRPGFPELGERSSLAMLKSWQPARFVEGTPGVAFCAEVAPLPGEVVVTRRRVNPYLDTDLPAILRAWGTETLVVMGVATGGVVLPTVRDGRDRDFRVVLLEDCCANQTEESHAFLIANVLSGAVIATSAEFVAALASG